MSPWQKALHRVALVSVVFSVLVLAGLVANALHARATDPNPPTKIDELVLRLNKDRNNKELLEQIRRQDAWIRTGYERSQSFAATGYFLLLGGVLVLLVSLKASKKLTPSLPTPQPDAPKRNTMALLGAQQGTLTLGLALAGFVTLVATLSRHDTVASYVADTRMPRSQPGAPKPKGEEQPAAMIPMAPSAGQTIAEPPAALEGSLPATPTVNDTTLVPLPVEPPRTPVAPSTPPKKVATSAPPTAPSAVAAWPGWRGPGANGIAAGDAPTAWNGTEGKGILWKTEVPLAGYGSPSVWGDRIFLSGADAKSREVYAFSAADGKLAWKTAIPMLPKSGPMEQSSGTGFAPATVAVDAAYVVAVFVNGDVACLDHSGKLLWSIAPGKLDNHYGHASSPLLIDGKLILQFDQGEAEAGKSSLMALDPKNGKPIWAVKRPVGVSWSTPLPLQVDGKSVLVTLASTLAIAHSLADGKEIWRADGIYGEVAPSPALGDGLVFVAQSGAGLMALGAGDGKVLWLSAELSLPDISSPVASNGIVFLSGPDGTLAAVDAKDGKTLWEHKYKAARSSPIVVKDRLYLTDNDGVTHIVQIGRTFKQLASNPIGEKVGATGAFVGGRIYLRGEKHLFCVGAQ